MKLQGVYVDVVYAYREVKNVKSVLRESRSNVHSFHSQIYTRALKMAGSVGVDESRPRLPNRQQHSLYIQHIIVVITSI